MHLQVVNYMQMTRRVQSILRKGTFWFGCWTFFWVERVFPFRLLWVQFPFIRNFPPSFRLRATPNVIAGYVFCVFSYVLYAPLFLQGMSNSRSLRRLSSVCCKTKGRDTLWHILATEVAVYHW